MSRIITLLSIVFCTLLAGAAKAQSFTPVGGDTVTISHGGTIPHNIMNLTGAAVTVTWHVINTNFPPDWLTATAFGICDNSYCRSNISGCLWNGTTGTTYTTVYSGNPTHDSVDIFNLALDLSSATSTGCYWVTVRMSDGTTSKNLTFVVCRFPTATPKVVKAAPQEVQVYPNPAKDELNVAFDEADDIKSVAVYNMIGKMMVVYKVAGNSASLDLHEIPEGVYYVRLANSAGDVVAMKKFTKQ